MAGDRDTESALDTLRAVVARMASMPGQRNMSSDFALVSLFLIDRRDEQTGR